MFCTDIPNPSFFIFSSATPSFLYYSHIPTALASILFAFYVFIKNRNFLASRALLLIAFFFGLWSFFDLILWTNSDSNMIMFFWSLINFIEISVSVSTLYFAYTFLEGHRPPMISRNIFGALLLVFLALIPTTFNLTGFDVPLCEAQQGSLMNYFYFIEVFVFAWLFIYLFRKFFKTSGSERKQVLLLAAGAIVFLFSFSGANLIASMTENWEILQYGLFGMPIFIGFLAYLIVKYNAFDIKLISAQVLVFSLNFLIASQFFFIRNNTNRILTGVTLALAIGFGYALIQSVKNEIKRKEELQMVTDRLAQANDRLRELDNAKTEFISIASHQLRTPLTAIRGYVSMMLEGSYGKVTKVHQDVLGKVRVSADRLIELVEDLLNISRMESGRMEYNFEKFSMEDLLAEIYDTFAIRAKERKLKLKLNLAEKRLPEVETDRSKIREVISNLVDNAIKYTPKGKVDISVSESGSKIIVAVKDSGIGVPKEEMPYLFQKFSRGKDVNRLSAGGTGLGLHVGRKMMEALGGRIWVESPGANLGSTFFVEVGVERRV